MFFFLDNAFWNGGGCSFPKFKFSGRRGEEQKKVGGGEVDSVKFLPGEYLVS